MFRLSFYMLKNHQMIVPAVYSLMLLDSQWIYVPLSPKMGLQNDTRIIWMAVKSCEGASWWGVKNENPTLNQLFSAHNFHAHYIHWTNQMLVSLYKLYSHQKYILLHRNTWKCFQYDALNYSAPFLPPGNYRCYVSLTL